MMWLVEKKIFHHFLDLGYEGVAIPIRVKFEFQVHKGAFVRESLKFEHLYNREALMKRYPNLKSERLDQDIHKTVKFQIREYLKKNGYLKESVDTEETE